MNFQGSPTDHGEKTTGWGHGNFGHMQPVQLKVPYGISYDTLRMVMFPFEMVG